MEVEPNLCLVKWIPKRFQTNGIILISGTIKFNDVFTYNKMIYGMHYLFQRNKTNTVKNHCLYRILLFLGKWLQRMINQWLFSNIRFSQQIAILHLNQRFIFVDTMKESCHLKLYDEVKEGMISLPQIWHKLEISSMEFEENEIVKNFEYPLVFCG